MFNVKQENPLKAWNLCGIGLENGWPLIAGRVCIKFDDQRKEKLPMSYWFEDPTLKALAPLALSTSIKGLSTLFFTPRIYAGYNVIPQGPVIGPTTIDPLANRCSKKFAFINKHSHGVGFRPGRIADRRWPFRKPQTVHKQQVRCYPGITTLYPKSASNPWAKAPLTASIRIWKWNFFAFYRLYPSCHVVAWRAKSDEITRSCILEMVRSP